MMIVNNNRSDIGETMRTREFTEECLLGAILIEATVTHSLAIRQIQNLISNQDFSDWKYYDNKRSRIFQAMTKCEHPEVVSVALKLQELGILRRGDLPYLSHLIAECPCSLDYLYYAKAVRVYSRGQPVNEYRGLRIGNTD